MTLVVKNCNGVRGKKAALEHMLGSLEPDIFIALESKLDPSVNSDIIPPNFSISRRDRAGYSDRVFIAVKDNIVVEPQPQFDTECEIRWIKVHLEATKTLLVGAYYRPTKSSTTSLLELNKSITMVRENFPRAVLMLAGDFNLHGIDWTTLAHTPTKPDKQDCELILSIAMGYNMEQLNLSPTRKKNILEQVLTISPDSVNSCDTGPGINDHDHIVITRCSLYPKQNKKKARTIRLFKKADWENIKRFLNDAEDTFANYPEGNSVDSNSEYFKSVLIDAVKKFVCPLEEDFVSLRSAVDYSSCKAPHQTDNVGQQPGEEVCQGPWLGQIPEEEEKLSESAERSPLELSEPTARRGQRQKFVAIPKRTTKGHVWSEHPSSRWKNRYRPQGQSGNAKHAV